MDLTAYMKAGYGALFVETTEIKRAIGAITVEKDKFTVAIWNMAAGLVNAEKKAMDYADPMAIIDYAMTIEKTCLILENMGWYFQNTMLVQKILNAYVACKNHQTCMVFVGTDASVIPVALKEFIPTIEFTLPDREAIRVAALELSQTAQQAVKQRTDLSKAELAAYDTTVTDDVVESSLGLTLEEIENVLALSFIEKKRFDIETIRARKRMAIKATGFMDFIQPAPIDMLGGLQLLKNYMNKRITAFEPDSIKPKMRSALFVGFPGTGKTLAAKVLINMLGWPGIILDVAGLKGGIVGETEKNTRHATKMIDAFGKCIVIIDEIEKAFAGSTGHSLDGGASAGILGHFLTWMQERTSQGILIATSNDLSKLPPEFLRAGRWDAIFFVDLPSESEVKQIIEIMNIKWQANLPTDPAFCKELATEGWTGAEIEQLAKESHFDDIKEAMGDIPILARTKRDEMEVIRKQAARFRNANRLPVIDVPTDKPQRRRLQVGTTPPAGPGSATPPVGSSIN